MVNFAQSCWSKAGQAARLLKGLVLAVPFACAFVPVHVQAADALTPVTFMLDFSVMGRHAPWYVAIEKGYFKEKGLDVKIVPGQGTAQSLQALEANVAEFVFSDPTALIFGRSRGDSTGVFVEMNYQKAPYSIFSLTSGANIRTLAQLEGQTVASSADSQTPAIIKGLMKQQGLDPAKVSFTNVAPPARPAALLAKKVPAIETFVFGKVGMERNAGPGEVQTMLLANQGLKLYSDGVLVKEAYAREHPDLVKAFVEASIKGWRDALADIPAAAAIQHKLVPALDEGVIAGELEILKEMAITPATEKNGIGYIDPETMQQSLDFIVENMEVGGKALTAADLYTNAFQPAQPIFLP